MAERLTKEYYYTWDENGTKKLSYIQKLQNKLGKLEDILEKYGIESVEELDYLLEVFKKMRKQYGKLNQENCKSKKELDTWKRACELACEKIGIVKVITDDNMSDNSDNLPNYFYQQAKKESESK